MQDFLDLLHKGPYYFLIKWLWKIKSENLWKRFRECTVQVPCFSNERTGPEWLFLDRSAHCHMSATVSCGTHPTPAITQEETIRAYSWIWGVSLHPFPVYSVIFSVVWGQGRGESFVISAWLWDSAMSLFMPDHQHGLWYFFLTSQLSVCLSSWCNDPVSYKISFSQISLCLNRLWFIKIISPLYNYHPVAFYSFVVVKVLYMHLSLLFYSSAFWCPLTDAYISHYLLFPYC